MMKRAKMDEVEAAMKLVERKDVDDWRIFTEG